MSAPARGYSWRPFQTGNAAAVRHGVWSARAVDPVAEELVTALVEDRPDLAGYPETVEAWARAEARCLLLAAYHAERGLLDEKGNVRAGQYVTAFERLAADLRARLGLDPRSEAELRRAQADAVQAAVDLDGIRARGRAALNARADGGAADDASDGGVPDG